jgi:hypothetical protein
VRLLVLQLLLLLVGTRAGQPRDLSSVFNTFKRCNSTLNRPDRPWASYNGYREMKLTAHFQIVCSLIMCKAIPPLPHTLHGSLTLFSPLMEPGYFSQYSYSPRAGRSGDRIPVGAKYSAPVQTGPGAHPASYIMGTGSFPGVKRPGRGVEHPPHLRPRLKKE